jgi:hypothetical protein
VRKVVTSLTELITDIARRKHAAAIARRRPDPSAEKPADVAAHCLALVAAALIADGYVSRAGGRRLVKRSGDFTYEIWFQLDRDNYAGGRVAVWAHAVVGSLKLRRWRTHNRPPWIAPGYPNSGFAGGQIGNLRAPVAWMEWDFADPASREATVRDLISAIRQIVLPFFAKFSDPASVMEAFNKEQALLAPTEAIEYAQAHFGRDAANQVVKMILAKDPALIEPFRTAVELYRREGLPRARNGELASGPAAMAVFLALDLLGP